MIQTLNGLLFLGSILTTPSGVAQAEAPEVSEIIAKFQPPPQAPLFPMEPKSWSQNLDPFVDQLPSASWFHQEPLLLTLPALNQETLGAFYHHSESLKAGRPVIYFNDKLDLERFASLLDHELFHALQNQYFPPEKIPYFVYEGAALLFEAHHHGGFQIQMKNQDFLQTTLPIRPGLKLGNAKKSADIQAYFFMQFLFQESKRKLQDFLQNTLENPSQHLKKLKQHFAHYTAHRALKQVMHWTRWNQDAIRGATPESCFGNENTGVTPPSLRALLIPLHQIQQHNPDYLILRSKNNRRVRVIQQPSPSLLKTAVTLPLHQILAFKVLCPKSRK